MTRFNRIFILCFLCSGCFIQPTNNQNQSPGSASPDSSQANSEDPDNNLVPLSPNVVYANGWLQVIISAYSTKTTVDSGAHFSTTRNACGRDAFGAIGIKAWNSFAQNVNTIISKSLIREDNENCISPPDVWPYMDDSVEIVIPDGQTKIKKPLYTFKGGQICSTIQDQEVSNSLLNTINELISIADKEDCPRGWGS